MKTKLAFYPYEINSRGLVALTHAINETSLRPLAVRVNGNSETFRVTDTKQLINWGSSRMPANWPWPTDGLNHPQAVNVAGNKLNTFRALAEANISIPEYTTDPNNAFEWIVEGHSVVERHVLRGHSGEGIRIARSIDELSDCPLYVKYKKKKNEYRVHVFKGTVLFVQEKRRERDRERTADESMIRSHQHGWNFCRENVFETTALHTLAISAVDALELDFGAVDIIYNQREDQYYVLEVNTAPGLEGQSLTDYANAFVGLLGQ
jgi:glutathione synthase/RimK-type ligase-like ATP-grasp enzyme